ncbi:hypothetical protein CBR_g17066 [Chara braunii]|uniref:Uncharacterized protein n=1 Tax=Chara braunii TaxID=69332 RepID=A0A388KUJ4_CHABU|nr:hypothetical protein CBR_g17066 [Chara braunii]|eukprot:GBG73726.1 hypothetical protein CBR_g17066 [Chara braunii]
MALGLVELLILMAATFSTRGKVRGSWNRLDWGDRYSTHGERERERERQTLSTHGDDDDGDDDDDNDDDGDDDDDNDDDGDDDDDDDDPCLWMMTMMMTMMMMMMMMMTMMMMMMMMCVSLTMTTRVFGSANNDAKAESKEVDSDEVTKLRAEVEKLKHGKDVASTSAAVFQTTCEAEEVARLRKEHADVKAATDKHLATLEEVIFALQKQCKAAEANADVWRNEALRPGNKRGSVAIGHTPVSDARVRARITPVVPPCSGGRVNIQLKDIVERHQREVELLKEMRAREVKARKESEDEVDRLKNEMARLNTGRRSKGTDLRRKMDEAVVPTTKGKTVVDVVDHVMQRDVFLRAAGKELRGKRKEEVIDICDKEGVEYTTLDPTKEAIAQGRADRAVGVDLDDGKGKGKDDTVVEVTDDGGDNSEPSDGRDSATS